jgi:hypothetical protein
MANPLFSTYSKGENRITSSILAVFERVGISVLTSILQGIFEDSNLQLIEFTNQIKSGKDTRVPDARIKASFDFIIETKTKIGSVDLQQLRGHLDAHSDEKESTKLIFLTPHETKPNELNQIGKKYYDRIVWTNFNQLLDRIEFILTDSAILLTERESFLLSELKDFIIKENLLFDSFKDRVIVIPAKTAIPLYQKICIYACQPNRTFKLSQYIAFYSENRIYEFVPKILAYCENIDLRSFEIDNILYNKIEDNKDSDDSKGIVFKSFVSEDFLIKRLTSLKAQISERSDLDLTSSNKVFILTGKTEGGTISLGNPIINNIKSESGRIAAFVQNQRYVLIDKIKRAKTTSELNEKI